MTSHKIILHVEATSEGVLIRVEVLEQCKLTQLNENMCLILVESNLNYIIIVAIIGRSTAIDFTHPMCLVWWITFLLDSRYRDLD